MRLVRPGARTATQPLLSFSNVSLGRTSLRHGIQGTLQEGKCAWDITVAFIKALIVSREHLLGARSAGADHAPVPASKQHAKPRCMVEVQELGWETSSHDSYSSLPYASLVSPRSSGFEVLDPFLHLLVVTAASLARQTLELWKCNCKLLPIKEQAGREASNLIPTMKFASNQRPLYPYSRTRTTVPPVPATPT